MPAGEKRNWSAEDEQSLETLAASGHSYGKIAKLLKRSRNAVISKAHRLGLPERPSPIHSDGTKPRPSQVRRAGASTLPPLASVTDET